MKTKTVIQTNIEELKDYAWLQFKDGDDICFVDDADNIVSAAKLWKMTPVAVEALKDSLEYMAETLIDALIKDLADIWKVANDQS